MRFTRSLFALSLAAAMGIHASIQAEEPHSDATDLPVSVTTETPTVVCEESVCPVPGTGGSPWFDPMNLRFFAEAGINLVRPVQHGPVMVGGRSVANAFGPAGAVTTNFRFPLQAGPRVTLGVMMNDHWGVMMSWWGFEDGATSVFAQNTSAAAGLNFASVPLQGIPGFTSPSAAGTAAGVINDAMSFTSRVKLQIYDWDWFCDKTVWGWNCRTTIGARYAYLSQSYTALRVNSGTGPGGTLTADNDYITSGHSFSGMGPGTGMILRRPVFHTNLHLFFSDRLCVLLGTAQQRSTQVSTLAGTLGNSTTVTNGAVNASICVPSEDIETGFEWARDYDSAHVFLRTAFIGQTYFDVGNATSIHGNLAIIGMSLVGGVTY